MIIPRHKVCDICKEPVGVNLRYFDIKSNVLYVGYIGCAIRILKEKEESSDGRD